MRLLDHSIGGLLGIAIACGITACGRPGAGAAAGETPSPVASSGDTATSVASGAEAGDDSADRSLSARAARADSVRESYTPADVDFMTGMIHHHGQALVMARMAPTHGASPELQLLAERIINSQKGEIRRMQDWLRDRNETVPEPVPAGMDMTMHGDGHTQHMPGMLSEEQLAALDAARGVEFDRLFLTYMIQHHTGALTMVENLLDSRGAQNETVFQLASMIGADQTAEIERMQSMLEGVLFGPGRSP